MCSYLNQDYHPSCFEVKQKTPCLGAFQFPDFAIIPSLPVLKYPVCPGSHDEVVTVQSIDNVGPPSHRCFLIFLQYSRVRALHIRQFTKSLREFQCTLEYDELKSTSKPLDAILFRKLPFRNQMV